MARLTLSVFALLLACSTGWSQTSAPGRITINAAQVGQNLLLRVDIPAMAVSDAASSAKLRLQTLSLTLRDSTRAFTLPEAAGCEQTGGDVIHRASSSFGPAVSAGWEFTCVYPDAVNSIGISLFSLVPVESMDAIVFPDGQQVITKDRPVLDL
jgi:hypothetical protein